MYNIDYKNNIDYQEIVDEFKTEYKVRAFEIIKEKVVETFLLNESKTIDEYNLNRNWGAKELTQDEYNLLKEVLEDE